MNRQRENPISFAMGGKQNIKRRVKIYDTTLKSMIKECDSLLEASKFTGISVQQIAYAIKHKTRNKTNKLCLILAFR